MDVPDDLLCVFTAEIERRNGSYVIEIPEHEVEMGTLQTNSAYRVAMLSAVTETGATTEETPGEPEPERERGLPEPPVEEGEVREVDIEDIGEQGDGIARVERGFVVIIPDTEKGERVTVEITDVRQNVAFGEVIDRQTHFG